MNNDLISRSDAIEAITGWDTEPTDFDIEYELSCLPAVDAEPVRHGRWVAEIDRMGNYAHCSECGCRCRGYAPNYKYCPNCGAKMDAEVEG